MGADSKELDDIAANPEKYGAPTFEDFCRNRDKYIARDDSSLADVDNGSNRLGRIAKKYIYEIEGYRCKTLEEVEKVAACQGIPLKELDYRPVLIPQGGGEATMLVKFISRNEKVRRDSWE